MQHGKPTEVRDGSAWNGRMGVKRSSRSTRRRGKRTTSGLAWDMGAAGFALKMSVFPLASFYGYSRKTKGLDMDFVEVSRR